MKSPMSRFSRSTSLSSTARLSAAGCFRRPRVPGRLPLLPSDCWEEKREVTARFLRIARTIVEAHHEHLGAQNQNCGGTSFPRKLVGRQNFVPVVSSPMNCSPNSRFQ